MEDPNIAKQVTHRSEVTETFARRRLLVLAAPSGAGKTTIAHRLLERNGRWRFSISATTRPRRSGERDGVDYYFLDRSEFERRIARGDLIEYEEIFGHLYGTLRSATESSLASGQVDRVVFDVDVNGALSLRRAYPHDTVLCFVAPPSKSALRERLERRSTETSETIMIRMARVDMEMAMAGDFDVVVVNDTLERAVDEIEGLLRVAAGPEPRDPA